MIGQLEQLTATATFTNGVVQNAGSGTTGPTWQTSSPTVATVSTTGAVTPVGAGSAVITAAYLGKTGSINLAVSGTGQLVSCGTYTASGTYVAATDLTSTTNGCVTFQNVSSTQLNCNGHNVSSVNVSGARGLSISNCSMHIGPGVSLSVSNSTQVTVTSVDVSGQVQVYGCQGCSFTNSEFVFPMVACTPGSNSLEPAEVILAGGNNNVVSQNTIDAGWDGAFSGNPPARGCDDAVLLEESGDRIQGNVVRNAYDAGIEGNNSPTLPITAIIQGNTISRVGYTGIGGYYTCGWQNSSFSGNTVSNSPSLLYFVHDTASGAPGPSSMTFTNNQIVGNTFLSPSNLAPLYGGGMPASATIDYVSGGLPFTVSANTVQSNNFGTASGGPVLLPATGFIDGGGNVCSPSTSLMCQSGAGSVAAHVPTGAGGFGLQRPSNAQPPRQPQNRPGVRTGGRGARLPLASRR